MYEKQIHKNSFSVIIFNKSSNVYKIKRKEINECNQLKNWKKRKQKTCITNTRRKWQNICYIIGFEWE